MVDDQENQGKGKQLNNLTNYTLQVKGQVEEAHTSIGQEVEQVPIADLADAICVYADRLSTGENKARTTSYTVHTQRDNKDGTRSRAMITPFIRPGMRPMPRPAAAPASTTTNSGTLLPKPLMTRAATTDAMPITKPVERSIPPEIMTKV